MTNYEKIKQMSVEEMAEWLFDGITDCDCCIYGLDFVCPNTCLYGVKQWLEREMRNENSNKQKTK